MIAAALVLLGAAPAQTQEPLGCAVLVSHVERSIDEDRRANRSPTPVNAEPPKRLPVTAERAIERFRGNDPPAEYLLNILRSVDSSAPIDVCPSLAELLEESGVEVIGGGQQTSLFDGIFTAYGMPAVSENGLEAANVILVGHTSGTMIWGVSHFRFQDGIWKKVSSAIIGSSSPL